MKALAGLMIFGVVHLWTEPRVWTAEPIRVDQVAKLQTLIKPSRDEDRWAAIPWLNELCQARQLAARQGKPILLWEMDGHPLGCT